MKEIVKILKGLGNERRLKILKILKKDQEKSVGDLADNLNLSFRSTSRHLRKMGDLGLVKTKQSKTNIFYSIDKDRLDIINFILSKIK